MKIKQKGFIQLIIILVIVLIVLGYFGFNVQHIVQSPQVSDNLHYVWGLVVSAWEFTVNVFDKFIIAPIVFIWEKMTSIFH